MAASLRSHFRHTPQHTDPSSDPPRKSSSRIPTRSSSTESQRKPNQHVSMLAKRGMHSGGQQAGTLPTANIPPRVSSSAKHVRDRDAQALARPGASQPSLDPYLHPATRDHQLPPPPALRTPSLISGSSASTFDSPRSIGLRRKPSTIDRYAAQKEASVMTEGYERSMQVSTTEGPKEESGGSVFGMSLPPTSADAIDEAAYRMREWNVTRDITTPVPPSTTPSTRYTQSPWSVVPTPSTSASSPALLIPTGLPASPHPRPRSPPRSRTTNTGRSGNNAGASRLGLHPVRESSTSSSNSTVKHSDYKAGIPVRKQIPRKPVAGHPVASTPSASKPIPRSASSTAASLSSSQAPPKRQSQTVQIPPELAHLNVDPPVKASINKPLPPLRPSRDNTPSIPDLRQTASVVQSDLPRLYTTYHKRTPSQDTPISPSAPSPSFKSRFGLSSRGSSKQSSPRVDSAISPPPSARNFTRGPTPEPQHPEPYQRPRMDSPAIGPSPSPSKSSRFGFFSRKSRGDVTKGPEKPQRLPVKGPAAGTGHEGYGRFGIRGRSGSSASSTGLRSPSAASSISSVPRASTSREGSLASSKDQSELDEFLRERSKPVILRGSGSTVSNAPSTSDVLPPSTIGPSSSSSLESYPTPQLLPSAMKSDHGIVHFKRPQGRRTPSESSEDDVMPRYPTLATRRSLTRMPHPDGQVRLSMISPINTDIRSKSQPVVSDEQDTTMWRDSTLPAIESSFAAKEAAWRRTQQVQEPVIKPTRKWNFFQRAQASPRPKGKQKAVDPDQVSVSEATGFPSRNVAHYAMMDQVEPVDLYEVERILQEGETSPETSMSELVSPPRLVPYERRHNSLLPSPPKAEYSSDADFKAKPTPPRLVVRHDYSESPELLRAQTAVPQPVPQVVDIPQSPFEAVAHQPPIQGSPQLLITPEMSQGAFDGHSPADGNESPRQPRLSPIGRIPRIVSKRDRDRKLPDNSFSRPFARAQPHPSVKPPGTLYNQIRSSREMTSPIELGSQPVSSTSTRSEDASAGQKSSTQTNAPSTSTNRTSVDLHTGGDFIAFTPRKGSEVSYSSSSGIGSWIVAAPPLQEDDPWAEYNDLLDDMMPLRTPLSAGSSLGAPFQYASVLHDANSPALPTPLNFRQPPPSSELPLPPRSNTVPAVLSVPQRVNDFMQPTVSPLTPHTLSDLVDGYANRSTSTLISTKGTSLPVAAQRHSSVAQSNRASMPNPRISTSSCRYSQGPAHSRSASLPEANERNSQSSLTPSARFHRDTQLLDIPENEGDAQAAMNNLRFGALMTSKWLSLGRVLFSPAHNEIRLSDEPKVLVLDGLGSDWSYYVALSYPAATVYNLGPAVSNGSTAWPGINQKPPQNHRQIPHTSLSSAFPFPKGFFTAVVFRFPVVSSEHAYHACICECKRVLRPGGHLEVAVLDLDLMNMGTRARTLVRGVKTRLQGQDPNVSLRNLSDILLRMVGRRGFEEVQRCIVGIPAAGRIPRSQDISSISSGNSGNGKPRSRGLRNSTEKEFSFQDLLEDARNNQVGPDKGSDESITKMVAKVGRWWYTCGYESRLLGTDRSIWDDPALLRECEKQGTSFRLLICCAQKPAQTRRRTVSV